ncbi:MAG: methylenetetrahydrofolate reductase [NAD(P)H] [Elusimicrobia bacterium]|nr:methylenetetrahydrofolate reductase [NAD(P)H] [Elusimicrobiota bacterium]
MEIPALFSRREPVFSFEFFLPKKEENTDAFLSDVRALKSLGPAFVTLTYGAGGSARGRTIDVVGRMQKEVGIETVCHLTGITHTRAEMGRDLERIEAAGIRHIMVLRGDQPVDWAGPLPGDFPHAVDLVRFIRQAGGFRMAVAGYPETHPEAASPEADLRRLAEKVQAGAEWVVTQLFFDNRHYFDFAAAARRAGITVPIVPGIMPVTGYAQLQRFTTLCGASIPARMREDLERIHEDADAVARYGIEWAVRQCRELLDGGAPGIHFYTLNRSHSTTEILGALRLRKTGTGS